jgi:hypothetical protein
VSIPIRCWSVFCFRFPTNRILFYVGSRMGVGVGGEASSHVAQSVVYVICWLQLCIGFPANRILFCVGSGRVCSVGGALENAVLSLEIAAGACWALENAVPSLEIAALLGAACALEIAALTCSGAHTPRAFGRGYVPICSATIFIIYISCQ